MKFKTRLVAKIRPEGPLRSLKLLCKIFLPHLKNPQKNPKKYTPQKRPFFGGGGGGKYKKKKHTSLINFLPPPP